MIEPLEHRNSSSDSETASTVVSLPNGEHESRARGLLAIGIFKLAKAVFFFAIGLGALHLVHSDVGNLFMRITSAFHLDPDGRFVEMLQDKADLLSGHRLRQLSLFTFGYSGLSLVEGVGLMMQKTWAEYLTLTLTIVALPWDLTELIRQPGPVRAVVVLINVLVLAYLLWFVWWHRRQMRAGGSGAKVK